MTEKDKVFLLLGPEEGEKFNYIRQIIKTITQNNGEKPEVLRLYSFESNIIDIVALLQNKSLFSQHTVIILNNVEAIKDPNDLRILSDYLKNPSALSTLFLLSQSVQDVHKEIASKIPEKNKVIFWELFENQKKEWLQNYFRRQKIQISHDALQFLLEMIENNTRDLKSECNKLALFFGPSSVIRGEDLEKYLYHSKEENVFTLFERIAQRDFITSIEILEKILSSGDTDPGTLLSGLLWQLRKLLSIKILLNNNYRGDEVFQRCGVRSKKSQRIYLEAHTKYSLEEVKQIIVLVSDCDRLLRTIRADLHRLLLQCFIYYCIKKGGIKPRIKDIFFF
jgi:DNA polymerase-3 subunit delta